MGRHGTGMSSPFDEAFAGNQGRDKKYSQWSERAVIVGFNRALQAYDIMITTEQRTGNDKRSLNRTIRQVKSLKGNALQFSPGDSVLVGYVADQREHPIILGQGDNFVQTPLKTILPTGTSPSTSEGEGPLSDGQPFQSACGFKLEDTETGSTTSLTIDCNTLDIDGCFTSLLQAKCACGGMSWSISAGVAGVTVELQPFGPNDTFLKLCPSSVNTPVFPGVTAYTRIVGQLGNTSCDSGSLDIKNLDCQDVVVPFFGCRSITFGQFDGCGQTGPVLCRDFACSDETLEICNLPVECAVIDSVGVICDVRTQEMLDGGCAPCGFLTDLLVTGSDLCGNQVTIEISL